MIERVAGCGGLLPGRPVVGVGSVQGGASGLWSDVGASNAVIPLVAIAGTLGTSVLTGVSPSAATMILVAAGSFLIYQFEDHLLLSASDVINCWERRSWALRNGGVVGWSIRASTAAVVLALCLLPPAVLWVLLALAIPTTLYQCPVWSGRPWKAHPVAKPLLVAGGWSGGVVLLPAVASGAPITALVWAIFVYRMVPYLLECHALRCPRRRRRSSVRRNHASGSAGRARHGPLDDPNQCERIGRYRDSGSGRSSAVVACSRRCGSRANSRGRTGCQRVRPNSKPIRARSKWHHTVARRRLDGLSAPGVIGRDPPPGTDECHV
jgi:hypothetical protein